MTQNIITASGAPAEILEKLKLLKAIFGEGATLAEIQEATQYARLKTEVRQNDKNA